MRAGAIRDEDRLSWILGQLRVDNFPMRKMDCPGNVGSGKLISRAHVEQDEILVARSECMVHIPTIRFELQNGFEVCKCGCSGGRGYFSDDGHGELKSWLV